MATIKNLLDEVGRRTALLSRTTGKFDLATQPDDEQLLKTFLAKGAFSIAIASGAIKPFAGVVVSASGKNITLPTLTVPVDGLKNAYITINDQSNKIISNTEANNENCSLVVADTWDTLPIADDTYSLCDAPEYPVLNAQYNDLLKFIETEKSNAVVYWIMSEWFSSIGEEQQSEIYKQKFEDDKMRFRITPRQNTKVSLTYRPI